MRRYLPKNVEEILHWYERYISPASLIAGFLADNLFFLRRVDLLVGNILLLSYLLIAAGGIVLINAIQAGRIRGKVALKVAPFIPVVVQFCFGGLFSGFVSLYSRSASVAVSWIFVAALAALLLGNERFTRLYARLPFQIGLYFLALISFLEFFIPVILRRIGPWIFILSGVVSLTIIAGFMYAMKKLVPQMWRESGRRAVVSVGVIFIIFNALYFTNMIPPLPLSLKDAGVYHSVVPQKDGSYVLRGEPLAWYEQYLNYAPTFHRTKGETVYVWSAVFAPSGLSTEVLHEWQLYDPVQKQWETTNTVSFAIFGGRDGGYRGYSKKINPAEGKWRVNVITQYGHLLGRISLQVVAVPVPVSLETTKL